MLLVCLSRLWARFMILFIFGNGVNCLGTKWKRCRKRSAGLRYTSKDFARDQAKAKARADARRAYRRSLARSLNRPVKKKVFEWGD